MSNEEYKKITDEYMAAFAELNRFRSQFFHGLSDGSNNIPRAMNHDDLEKLKALKAKEEELREKWRAALEAD